VKGGRDIGPIWVSGDKQHKAALHYACAKRRALCKRDDRASASGARAVVRVMAAKRVVLPVAVVDASMHDIGHNRDRG
jgi:hypothetical protein